LTRLESSSELLIGQWEEAPRIRALIEVFHEIATDDILTGVDRLQDMRTIDLAEGIHLDRIGQRLGVGRPITTNPELDPRFGFGESGQSFDAVAFEGDPEFQSVFPIPDTVFRKLLKARAVTLLSAGEPASLLRSIHELDQTAVLIDNRDMTIDVFTNERDLIEIADQQGAIARNAGVLLQYKDRDRFGFDEAGQAFDQSPFEAEKT